MKSKFLGLVLMLLLFIGVAPAQRHSTVTVGMGDSITERCLQDYMWRYPKSQLRDLYKFCFQDFFGLEHLLSDSAAAMRYLEYDISHADSSDWLQTPFVYPLTLKGDYVRVDINYVRMGVIPVELMVAAMMQSGRESPAVDKAAILAWKATWADIVRCLKNVTPRPLNYDEDSAEIDRMLAQDKYAIHHSQLFNTTYHQHYRIIKRDVFNRMLAPLLK